jgi:hypothetical protein
VEVARNLLAKEAETGTVLAEWDVVIALFDGEEEGLLGSYLFAKDHPWMPKVRAVLTGCSYMDKINYLWLATWVFDTFKIFKGLLSSYSLSVWGSVVATAESLVSSEISKSVSTVARARAKPPFLLVYMYISYISNPHAATF